MATYFGAIITSFVNGLLIPPIGLLLGSVDFSEFKLIIQASVKESATRAGDGVTEEAITYGIFINTVIAIFIVTKAYNPLKEKMEKKEAAVPAAPTTPSKEEVPLTEIRNLLKK
jgi:large conductance mechanosensitive channel